MPIKLRKLLEQSRVKRFPKDQIIIYEGDQPAEAAIIKSGVVKLYDIDAQGNEKILQIVSESTVIPLAFFSGAHTATRWSYATITDCEAYILEQDKLRALMHTDPETADYLIQHFSEEVHELLVHLNSLSKTLTAEKVISVLRFLVVHHTTERPHGWHRVNFPISHQLVASIAGITRESTSSILKQLADARIIRNPKLALLEIHRKRLLATEEVRNL